MVNGFVVSDNFVVLIRLDDVSLAREKRIQFNCSESNDWQRISLGYSLFIISWLFLFTNNFFASFNSVGFVQRETNSLKYWLWRASVEIWNVTSLRFDEQTFLLLFFHLVYLQVMYEYLNLLNLRAGQIASLIDPTYCCYSISFWLLWWGFFLTGRRLFSTQSIVIYVELICCHLP